MYWILELELVVPSEGFSKQTHNFPSCEGDDIIDVGVWDYSLGLSRVK